MTPEQLLLPESPHFLLGAALSLAPSGVLLALHLTSELLSHQLPSAELLSVELRGPEFQSSELATWLVEAECRERPLHLDQRRRRLCVSA